MQAFCMEELNVSMPYDDGELETRLEAAKEVGLDALLRAVLTEGLRLVGTSQGTLMLVNAREGVLEIMGRVGPKYNPKRKFRKFPLGQGIAGKAAHDCKPYLCDDVEKEPTFVRPLGELNFHSLLVVPIVRKGEAIGVICADSPEVGKFNREDTERLEHLAAHVTDAFDELAVDTFIGHAKRLKALDTLHGVVTKLTRVAFEPKETLSTTLSEIAREAENVLDADIVTLYQYNQDEDSFTTPPTLSGDFRHPELMNGPIYPDDIPDRAVKAKQTLFTEHVQDEARLAPSKKKLPTAEKTRPSFVHREGVLSSAGIPLQVGDETVGVMFVNYRIVHPFSDDDKFVIQTFAADAALAIQGARLVQKTLRAKEAEMHTREETAAMAVHNLNNPASGVRLALQNIRDAASRSSVSESDRQSILGSVENALDQVQMILRTRENFLNFIREHYGEPMRETDMGEFVNAIWSPLRPKNPNVQFSFSPDPVHRRLAIHPAALRAVLTSLLQNSVEATSSVANPRIQIGIHLAQDLGTLEVTDNGPGVPEDDVPLLFESFNTTKPQGMGVGLSVARRIMRKVGGDIRYDRSEGGATRFAIQFPYSIGANS